MTDEEGQEVPTHDFIAEQTVIGAVLERGLRVLDELEEIGFAPEYMYAPKHEIILRAAMAVAGRGEPVGAVTVAEQVGPDLQRIGGPAYLHTCMKACTSPAAAPYHAKIVASHANWRALDVIADKLRGLRGSSMPVSDAVDYGQGELAALAERVNGSGHLDDMGSSIDAVLDRIENGGDPAIPTGLAELDRILMGGLQVGTLTTVAARPGVGKTVLGLQIALNVALAGEPVGYTTLEMSSEDLLIRGGANLSKVDYGRIQKSPTVRLTDSEIRSFHRAMETIRDSGLFIPNRTKASTASIRADIRETIRRRGSCGVWCVDYLGLVTPFDKRVIREQQIAGITRDLKSIALETGVPILMMAQLNREGEKSGRPPVLTDLRESGAIEQDSDNVILMHRDALNKPDLLGVSVAKNRRGPQTNFTATFEGSYQRISERPWTPTDVAR